MHNSFAKDAFIIEGVARDAVTINEVARILSSSDNAMVDCVYHNMGIIPAIKLVRLITGQGLKASKLYVDAKYRNKIDWMFTRDTNY